jgi:hypothetical protein
MEVSGELKESLNKIPAEKREDEEHRDVLDSYRNATQKRDEMIRRLENTQASYWGEKKARKLRKAAKAEEKEKEKETIPTKEEETAPEAETKEEVSGDTPDIPAEAEASGAAASPGEEEVKPETADVLELLDLHAVARAERLELIVDTGASSRILSLDAAERLTEKGLLDGVELSQRKYRIANGSIVCSNFHSALVGHDFFRYYCRRVCS